MALQTLSGTVSHVSEGSEIGYVATASQGAQQQTVHLTSFRVDGKPVRFRQGSVSSISNGDEVVVSGTDKQGTLEALALKNKTTGATHHGPHLLVLIGGIALVLMSLPLIPLLVGIPLAVIGGMFAYRGWLVGNAARAIAPL